MGYKEIADEQQLNELKTRSLSDALYSPAKILTLKNIWALSISRTVDRGDNSWGLSVD